MVFVTGATGLVGSHLLYFLVRSGYQITALKRRDSSLEEVRAVFGQYTSDKTAWNNIRWIEGNILDINSFEPEIANAACVYHCAAVVSFSGKDKDRLTDTNLKGTENVVQLALKYKVRMCYVSSIAALGGTGRGETICENTPVLENTGHSVYSQSKEDAEKIVWQYIEKGLNAVIVNPSIILGAGMWGRSSTRLFMTAVKGIPFYTRGVTGYVDVRDVCKLMIRLMEDKNISGERFILSGENCSYQDLFTTIAKIAGKRPPFIYMPPWFTGILWRLLALVGRFTGKQPSFTRETARSSHRRYCYSARKLLTVYPDYDFYTLPGTIQNIYMEYIRTHINSPARKSSR